MPGIFLDPSESPKFLTEKLGMSGHDEVIMTLLALVDGMGLETVFGRILRWKIDKSARKIIEGLAKKALVESGYNSDHYTNTQAITMGAGRLIMCHEVYIMDGSADDDVINLELESEMERMVGIGRVHEDDLATLMTPVNCVVTTTQEMMSAMYGTQSRRVSTGNNSHELVIFYDEYEPEEKSDEVENSSKKNNDPFARWAAGEE